MSYFTCLMVVPWLSVSGSMFAHLSVSHPIFVCLSVFCPIFAHLSLTPRFFTPVMPNFCTPVGDTPNISIPVGVMYSFWHLSCPIFAHLSCPIFAHLLLTPRFFTPVLSNFWTPVGDTPNICTQILLDHV